LHLIPEDCPLGQEPVNKVYRDVERFCLEPEANVNVNEPVNKDDPHVLIDLYLLSHVVQLRIEHQLLFATPEVNVIRVLEPIERNSHWVFSPQPVLIQSGRVNIRDFQ
jgi:hypothetical protein